MHRSIYTLLALLALTTALPAAEPEEDMPAAEPAEEERAAPVATAFGFHGKGLWGVAPPGERKFIEIVGSSSPAEGFRDWLDGANSAEFAFCLVGFYHFDRSLYNRLKEKHSGSDIEVNVSYGCLLESQGIDEIIERIESGEFERTVRRAYFEKGE